MRVLYKLQLIYWRMLRKHCLNQMRSDLGHEYVIDYYDAVNQIKYLEEKLNPKERQFYDV